MSGEGAAIFHSRHYSKTESSEEGLTLLGVFCRLLLWVCSPLTHFIVRSRDPLAYCQAGGSFFFSTFFLTQSM